jgi:NAD(P)-dependent dehydrogenase (short-subunit alcohol dehydrogenase family)
MPTITDLRDKVAVVTGGASGIGKGIAQRLVEQGARVIIADLDVDRLQRTAAEIGAVGVVADVTDAASVQALADTAVERFGSVHLVFNNAGVGPMAPIARMTLGDWKWMVDVNLWGVIHGVHSFLPLLQAHGEPAYIVNTASMSAFLPGPGLGAYTMTKMGVFGLTEVLAQELAQEGSNVGAAVIVPGTTRTDIKNSLRARPGGSVGTSLYDVDISELDAFRDMRWLDPTEVGDLVIDVLARGDSLVVTHPEWYPLVESQFNRILGAFRA